MHCFTESASPRGLSQLMRKQPWANTRTEELEAVIAPQDLQDLGRVFTMPFVSVNIPEGVLFTDLV